jgi:hypothetical protein
MQAPSIVEIELRRQLRTRLASVPHGDRGDRAAEPGVGGGYQLYRQRLRQLRARPIADSLHQWLILHWQKVPDGSATAKAIDYSLNRWEALTRYLDDGNLPIDNNSIENRISPVALGRSDWMFAGSLRAGRRAAVIMSPMQSAKLNGHDPYRYLKDVLERLPTQPASRIEDSFHTAGGHCQSPNNPTRIRLSRATQDTMRRAVALKGDRVSVRLFSIVL